ncbi:hypothetical protein FA95DRAFT_1563139, partial [Auriscalpium vulgare]
MDVLGDGIVGIASASYTSPEPGTYRTEAAAVQNFSPGPRCPISITRHIWLRRLATPSRHTPQVLLQASWCASAVLSTVDSRRQNTLLTGSAYCLYRECRCRLAGRCHNGLAVLVSAAHKSKAWLLKTRVIRAHKFVRREICRFRDHGPSLPIFFLAYPSKAYIFAPGAFIGKVYSNIRMVSLNNRAALRRDVLARIFVDSERLRGESDGSNTAVALSYGRMASESEFNAPHKKRTLTSVEHSEVIELATLGPRRGEQRFCASEVERGVDMKQGASNKVIVVQHRAG